MLEPTPAQKLAFDNLTNALDHLRNDDIEAAEDAICDVLDQFVGWCHVSYHLFPNVRFGDGGS